MKKILLWLSCLALLMAISLGYFLIPRYFEFNAVNSQTTSRDSIHTSETVTSTVKDHEEDVMMNVSQKLSDVFKPISRLEAYNNELQAYEIKNVTLEDEFILLSAREETLEDKNYTSGMVESISAYKYGYFEFNVSPPLGKGFFPAIWMMPVEDKRLPEIDLFEMIGSEPQFISGVVHYIDRMSTQQRAFFNQKVKVKPDYKVALNWSEETLSWYIDDKLIFETSEGVPNEYMYLIINLAVGGNWPGEPDEATVFPSELKIEKVILKPVNQKGRE